MAITLKIKYQEDVRRISLDDTSIENVKGIIGQLFPSLNGSFIIKYLDDENDLVTLSTQSELEEAIRFSKNNLLRLEIFASESQSSSSTSNSSTKDVPPLPNFANLFGNTSSTSTSQNAPPPLNFANLFGPSSPLASLFNPPQQQSQQPNNPFANLFGQQQQQSAPQQTSTDQGLPPFLTQLLNNPQIAQSLGSSLPTLINLYQNATPQQKAMVESFLQNPQIVQMIPQFLPLVSQFLNNNNGQNPFANLFGQQQQGNPFANLFGQQSTYSGTTSEQAAGHYCDVCENVIHGARYHCATCDNYDLCSFCSEIPDIHSHPMNKVQ